MIQEAYVRFETAKLLKEKGFDEICRSYFIENGADIRYCGAPLKNSSLQESQHLRPTQQMAMRWLREVHNIVICAEIGNENDKGNTDYTNPDRWHWFFDLTNEKGVVIEPESDYILNEFDSYEDAVEAAIKYCLTNLI